ncbi:MAG: aminomethyl-transferring glycine dehydrogenase [Bacteroidales bacterium]|jgi:glycine dehydrogenase|nr:aminomethyl-transferring glycine dehydrogenase [Bacteroidales bacterium]
MKQIKDDFSARHIGPNAAEAQKMLEVIGVKSFDELIAKTIPAAIRYKKAPELPEGMSEGPFLAHVKSLFAKNKLFKSYIGMGYYNTYTPAVILRNIFENPGWYTSYTPYQAEISQGRLEALLNYQTMVSSLTGMAISNASLLDEGTAAGEMMLMFFNSRSREAVKNNVCKYFVSEDVFVPTIGVMKTIAEAQGIELIVGAADKIELNSSFFGAMVQYPNQHGAIHDYSSFVAKAKEHNIFVGVAADLLALTLLTPPGEWGADCAVGSTQRFGIPVGYGSPAAGFFACKEDFKRQMPGRIIGVTVDAEGKTAYRMSLQMREQHIKRERATSNICTASALTAIMAGFYGMWHGAEGLKGKAVKINVLASVLAGYAVQYGYKQYNEHFFDTLCFETPQGVKCEDVRKIAEARNFNFKYWCETCFTIALDETVVLQDINDILQILAQAAGKPFTPHACTGDCEPALHIPEKLIRKTGFLTSAAFHKYHSETEMMRYMKMLEVKDLSLNRAMIPLGSCTMKLNAAAEMLPLSWTEICGIHPYVPAEQAQGYLEMIKEMEEWLCAVTGFKAVSFQPNSGAAGEYAGLTVIRNYHRSRGEAHRNVCLIPASAHGTNPASSAKAGNRIIVVKSTPDGEVDVADLKAKAEEYHNSLSCLMLTYPSTHGVFEEAVLDIIQIVHEHGGLVYMDGANMNAQVGFTSPGFMGADVCHLNLHKTFAMPHGGGGPGVGPIAVAEHLVDFLPKHNLVKVGGEQGSQVASAPFGSAYLLPITYGYLKMLGGEGLANATKYAILNANYMRVRLEKDYKILYTGKQGMCAHEMILDCNEFEKFGIKVGDIAKRLMDYGFHAPTVAFPVHGTLMVEPTESEPLSELDRLCDALIAIRREIGAVEEGKADKDNNVIVNAPHTMSVICADSWDRPYSRQQAAFPMPHPDKYWPAVSKIDDAYGDRNLVCCLE